MRISDWSSDVCSSDLTDIGIDQAFLPDKGTLTGSGFPGRMSPLTATAWMGLGPAILLLSLARKSVWLMVAHLLAAYAGFVAFVASAGYAFGGTTFWLINDYTDRKSTRLNSSH